MDRIPRPILFLVLVLLLIAGGGLSGYLAANQASSRSPRPVTPSLSDTDVQGTTVYSTQIAATIQAVEGGVIYWDAGVFASLQGNSDTEEITNTEKGLIITTKKPESKVWSIAAGNLPADVDVSVMAQVLPRYIDSLETPQSPKSDSCAAWAYGIDIRQPDVVKAGEPQTPFYNLLIYYNRTWMFNWYDGNSADTHVFAEGVLGQGVDFSQPNKMRVVAKGSHFDLYFNDEIIGAVDDPNAVIKTINAVSVSVEICKLPASVLFTDFVVKTAK